MGIIKNEDIIAYRLGTDIVCDGCAALDEVTDLKENDIIQESKRD